MKDWLANIVDNQTDPALTVPGGAFCLPGTQQVKNAETKNP
jgi:hypothetical protein